MLCDIYELFVTAIVIMNIQEIFDTYCQMESTIIWAEYMPHYVQ